MIKVLIVDDSVLFAGMLKNKLSSVSGIKVVGTAVNPYDARDKILELEPDVMTLDIEMPRMDGLNFLKKLLPQYPLPVIMVSSLDSKEQEAVRAGAVSFRVKPSASDKEAVEAFIKQVAADILKYGKANAAGAVSEPVQVKPTPVQPKPAAAPKPEHKESAPAAGGGRVYNRAGIEIVALGASTGGTDALEKVIMGLPSDCPPVVVTQHMPPVFTKMYAERLNRTTPLEVHEAEDGLRLKKGMCVIAAGGFHMELRKDAAGYFIKSYEGEKVSGHCPSVDVMFTSVAKAAGKATVAALLTGMGADGAKGLLQIRKTGAYTVGQNKETCVVYGMPMEAFKLGAVCEEAPLNEISTLLKKHMGY